MLDAMLLHDCNDTDTDAETFTQRAEEARQLARVRISRQQSYDAQRYNLRHRYVSYQPGEKVWVWSPIRRRGLSEKLLKRYFGPYSVVRRLSDVNYEVIPDSHSRTLQQKSEIVHVVRMKPYCAD